LVLPKDPKSAGSLVEAKGSRWDSDSVAQMGSLMVATLAGQTALVTEQPTG